MSVHRLSATLAATLLAGIALAAPAAASVQHVAAGTGMTSGRLGPTVTALVGLFSVIVGGLALTGRIGNPRRGAVMAVVSGLISLVLGGLFAATADGGPGTGNGIVGAFAAVVLGLIGVILGGLTLNRSRRVSRTG